jgi:hypothetical protein
MTSCAPKVSALRFGTTGREWNTSISVRNWPLSERRVLVSGEVKTEAGIEQGKVTKWLIYENKQEMGFQKRVMSIVKETY